MDFTKKKVNILGVEHSVVYLDKETCPKESWATHDPHDRVLELYDSQSDFEKFHLLLHEVLHAVGQRLMLNIHYNTGSSGDTVPETPEQSRNHMELHLIAYGITDFLFRNKLLKDT